MAEASQATVRATIRRASFAAHRAVEALDATSQAELVRVYRGAAADIAERIRAYAGRDENLTLQELRSVLAQVEGRLRGLGDARNRLIDGTLSKGADLGVDPYSATLGSTARVRIANEALNQVRTFIAEDGLQLSDRIWRLDRQANDAISNAIESAVIQGHGADQAAREFLSRGKPVPVDLQRKINAGNVREIGNTTTQLLTGTGSPMDNTLRVMRTELNRAHGEAYMKGGEGTPGFAGWRYLLSPSHPAPDICDLLNTQNLHGLGPGVYPTREKTPWPAHPNTLSFVEIVFDDEISAADRAGKETPLQALDRLSATQRQGVLGKGKAALHADGKLTQGMIRTPLRVLRQRLQPGAVPLPPTPIVRRPPPPAPVVPSNPRTLDEYIAWGHDRADQLLAEAHRRPGGFDANWPEVIERAVAQARPVGTAAKVVNRGKGADLVRAASVLFPDDWKTFTERNGPKLEVTYRNSRAYYMHPVSPGAPAEISAYNFRSALHEFTHRMQFAMPALDDYFQTLHGRRTAGDPLEDLGTYYSGRMRGEMARKDKYLEPYTGKEYTRGPYLGQHGAVEVMTMAMEGVLNREPGAAERLAKGDRELFDLVIGLLFRYVP